MSENSPLPAVHEPREPLGDPFDRHSAAVPAEASHPDVLIGISFDDPFRAEEFSLALHRLHAQGVLALRDVVVLAKDDDGKVRTRETSDIAPAQAAIQGAMWSGLLGLLIAGPLGWVAGMGIGAGAGAITAKVVDTGIPDEWVDWFKETVQPSTATVVALAVDVDLGALNAEARRFEGARLVHATLTPESTAKLAEALRRSGTSRPFA